jgi:hypothetical protein
MLRPTCYRLPVAQRQRKPTPTLAATVIAGTVWKTLGVNSKESRTRFAPTATRADASSNQNKSAVATTAPPTTQKGRRLTGAWLIVSVPRAEKRPTNTEPQGRVCTRPSRRRIGQASKVTASSVNDALPPRSWASDCQACVAPSRIAGDQSARRSRPATAYNATPGRICGAGPTNDCAASCTPNEPTLAGRGEVRLPTFLSGSKRSAGVRGCPIAVGGLGELLVFCSEVVEGLAAESPEPSPRLPAGLRVMAMINATASAASLQLPAWTRRADGFASALVKVTSATTRPAPAAENRTEIATVPPASTKLAGARARTRATSSARVVHAELASTSSPASPLGVRLSSATALRRPPADIVATSTRGASRARIAVSVTGSIRG